MGPPMEELLAGEIQTFEHERQLFNASGHQIWVLMTAAVVRDGDGEPLYVIEQVQDISERKRLENKLDHDALTGIRNRRLFEEDLFTQVGGCQRYGEHAALLLLDLDDFKQINDRYGHKTGDDTLKLVARTIKKRLRPSDQVARIGGDEFAALLPHLGRRQAEQVATELADAIAQAVVNGPDGKLSARASIGVASVDETSEDAQHVLAEADRAMYATKKAKLAAG